MTADQFVKGQLALLCWRNCPEGKALPLLKALAFVERNRVRAGWHGGDWMKIIAEDETYSAYQAQKYDAGDPFKDPLEEALAAARDFPNLRDDTFQRFLQFLDGVYDNTAGDAITEGALWWAELSKISRPWFREKVSSQPELHPRVAQVGPLTLWR